MSEEVVVTPGGRLPAMPGADVSQPHPRRSPVSVARRRVRTASLRRVVAWCAAMAAGLHTLAVLWTWASGNPGLRGGWLVWLDLPISLAYLQVMGERLLAWSLVAGGLQWAATGALLALIVGWASRR
ncbi:MAG TPA: hypothetical protein VHM02_01965 [Thermoanaerobaculia bacterium]|nr:hypothetical protein [Thermoanaerobaculia bacterium]